MKLNEERVKLFATILRLMTNPEIIKQLDSDEAFDYEALVRAIAEMCPLPAIDLAAPVLYPVPATAPFPTLPTWSPMRPLIGDPIGWPNNPSVCSGGTSDQPGSSRWTLLNHLRPTTEETGETLSRLLRAARERIPQGQHSI